MRFIAILLAYMEFLSNKVRQTISVHEEGAARTSREVILTLLWAGDTTAGALCPILGSPVQEKQGIAGDGPAGGYENGTGSGGKGEGSGSIQAGEEKTETGLYQCSQISSG